MLFVCFGNICRSPFAAASLQRQLTPALRQFIRVGSAGVYGIGRTPPPTAIEVAGAMGVDLTGHRSRLIETSLFRLFDLVFVMDPLQRRMMRPFVARTERVLVLGDLDPQPIETRLIHDPIGQDHEVFRAVYERIDRCVGQLARILNVIATR